MATTFKVKAGSIEFERTDSINAENMCAIVIVEFLAALAGGWPFGWQWDSGWGDYRGPGDDCADNQREAWALEYQARPRIEP